MTDARPSPRHSLGVAGAIVDEVARLLAIRRADTGRREPHAAFWSWRYDGRVREVEEETGLRVRPPRSTGVCGPMPPATGALVLRCTIVGEGMDEAYLVRLMDATSVRTQQVRCHIEAEFKPLQDQLDHDHLDDLDGLEHPTSENVARWIWERRAPELAGLDRIVVRETGTSGCTYEAPRRAA